MPRDALPKLPLLLGAFAIVPPPFLGTVMIFPWDALPKPPLGFEVLAILPPVALRWVLVPLGTEAILPWEAVL